jgi:hypothetical protein
MNTTIKIAILHDMIAAVDSDVNFHVTSINIAANRNIIGKAANM